MKTAVLIILYYPDEVAWSNISAYRETMDHILLYDNTPKEDGRDHPLYHEEGITYYTTGENGGMSRALEYGFTWALEQGVEILLTMDQDSDLPAEQIRNMLGYIRQHPSEQTAIYCTNYRKIVQESSGQETFLPARIRADETVSCVSCMTSGSFMRVSCLRELLPMDDMFIGLVDNDVCYQLIAKGYGIVMVGNCLLSQRVGSPIRDTLLNRLLHKVVLSEKRYFYMSRNGRYLKKKYLNCGPAQKQIARHLGKTMLRIRINLLLCETDRKKKIAAWRKGAGTQCPPFVNIG